MLAEKFKNLDGQYLKASPVKDINAENPKAWQIDKASPYHPDSYKVDEFFAKKAMSLSVSQNFHIVKGWFNKTLPNFDPNKKIAILRLDADLYESTLECLNDLYKYLVKGGIIIIDDYYSWDGCSRAVHDFLAQNNLADRICQFCDDFCYMIKA